jgi:hypothetical protein
MPEKLYPWTRFWYSSTESLGPDDGFLVDPTSGFSKYLHPQVISFSEIAQAPCLALLGEPGMGKTKAIEAEVKALEETGEQVALIPLGRIGSEERLVRKVFESQKFRDWLIGEHVFHLILDSLDEGRLSVEILHKVIVDELKERVTREQRGRLRLRITCRTAEWPHSMSKELSELWENEAAIYQLAPLREIDAREAAKQEDIDPDQFMEEVHDREVAAFAARPVTLKMLLSVFQAHRSLPRSKVEIYEQGCEILCGEQNLDRQERGRTGVLSARQRLSVASRLAAATVFANRRALRVYSTQRLPVDGEIDLSEVTGGEESVNGAKLLIEEREVRDTLTMSGLFTGAGDGDGLVVWTHQTYSEFLAARYLIKNEVEAEKVMGLITHPGDPNRKLAPQLHETAAWLASMDSRIFDLILDSNPETLLLSDVATADDGSRARLVGRLLQRAGEGRLYFHRWNGEAYYRKLDHPGISDQLRPILESRHSRVLVRELALEIAAQCQCSSLQDLAVKIALDSAEIENIRALALIMLKKSPMNSAQEQLRCLVVGEEASRVSHRLKGLALHLLWPNYLSSGELFTLLEGACDEGSRDNYSSFVYENPAKDLKGIDVVPALRWLRDSIGGLQRRNAHLSFWKELALGILTEAWREISTVEVRQSLAEAVRGIADSHVQIATNVFIENYRHDLHKRQLFLDTYLSLIWSGGSQNVWMIYYPWALVLSEDTYWLLERLAREGAESSQEFLANLVARSFDEADESQLTAVHEARQRYPILNDVLEWRLGPVGLDSGTARHMRMDFEARQEQIRNENERKQRVTQVRKPAELVEDSLREIESGHPEEWWRLNLYLLRSDNRDRSGDEYSGDLTDFYGWRTADARNQARILQAAREWILIVDLHTEEWIDNPENQWDHRPAAGYRAFSLLQVEDSDFLSGLESAVWLKWVPAILYFLRRSGSGKKETRSALFQECYQRAPQMTMEHLAEVVDRILEGVGQTNLLNALKHSIDSRIGDFLWSRLLSAGPSSTAGEPILRLLLAADLAPACAYVEELLRAPMPADVDALESVARVASTFVLNTRDCGRSVVWPICLRHPELGRVLWLKLADEMAYSIRDQLLTMGLEALGQLYMILTQLFPPDEDPDLVGNLSSRHEVVFLRGRILRLLANKGTVEACAVLENIVRTDPDGVNLQHWLFEAQENLLRKSFVWASPREILELVARASGRLVRTALELLNVVVESLGRLEQELQGHTPAAIDIWNKVTKRKYRPKDENELSDYIKRFLERDLKESGILFHREVEIRRRIGGAAGGGAAGERLDVLVSFSTPGVHETLAIIIEAKGAWHKELLTAMETQLVDRYLKDSMCRYGLYLVGWFNCPQWDGRDSRQRAARKFNREQLRHDLREQAVRLSTEKKVDVRSFLLNAALR